VMIQSPSFAFDWHIFSIFSITSVSVNFFPCSVFSASYSSVAARDKNSHTSHSMYLTSDLTARATFFDPAAPGNAALAPGRAVSRAIVVRVTLDFISASRGEGDEV